MIRILMRYILLIHTKYAFCKKYLLISGYKKFFTNGVVFNKNLFYKSAKSNYGMHVKG